MLSLLPIAQREPGTLPVLDLDRVALLRITDPWRRSKLAHDLARHLEALTETALQIRGDAVRELVCKHRARPAWVARHLGVSRARVGQLLAATTPAALNTNTEVTE